MLALFNHMLKLASSVAAAARMVRGLVKGLFRCWQRLLFADKPALEAQCLQLRSPLLPSVFNVVGMMSLSVCV